MIYKATGDITIDERGVAKCSGDVELQFGIQPYLEYNTACALSFEFVEIEVSDYVPLIECGIKSAENTYLKKYNYFDVLSSVRSTSTIPVISYDSIGVIIHLLFDKGVSYLFVNEKLYDCHYFSDPNNLSFFVSFKGEKCTFLTPFGEDIQKSFFPTLIPQLWTPLPFKVLIRGFQVRGTNDTLRAVCSEYPVVNLPGTNGVKYYEAIIHSIDSGSNTEEIGIHIGFTQEMRSSTGYPPGHSDNSIGFSSEDKTLTVNENNEYPFFFPAIESGDILGIGIHPVDGIFLTHNGIKINTKPVQDPKLTQYIPIIALNGNGEEVTMNFGQLPFKYQEISPPVGWTVFQPQQNNFFQKGPPSENHIYHFYPFSNHNSQYPDTVVARYICPDPYHFECTMIKFSHTDLIGVGFSDGSKYPICDMVGWQARSLAVHSDDGNIFYEDGNGSGSLFQRNAVQEGKSVGISFKNRKVVFNINTDTYNVINEYPYPPYPSMSLQGAPSFIFNDGYAPMTTSSMSDNADDVVFFNGMRGQMSSEGLESYDLEIGSMIESRDLSLHAKIAGMYKGRIFVHVKGINGVVSIDETDPLIFKLVYRITNISKPQPLLLFDKTAIFTPKVSQTVYATPHGLSLHIGDLLNGQGYVMRPVLDVSNNSHCFIADELKVDFLQTAGINPQFTGMYKDIQFLDLVEDGEHNVILALGTTNNSLIGWDNTSIVTWKSRPKVTTLFRFFGICLKRLHSYAPAVVNVGNHVGGILYTPNYNGISGSAFIQTSTTQRSYKSQGMTLAHPLAEYLMNSLNEKYLEKEMNRPETTNVEIENDWYYEAQEIEDNPKPTIPLITQITFP